MPDELHILSYPTHATSRGKPWTRTASRIAGRLSLRVVVTLMVVGACVAPFVLMLRGRPDLAGGPFGLFAALALCLVTSLLLASWLLAKRDRRVTLVLGYAEQAVRLNLPLATFLAAAAEGESGRIRRRLQGISVALSASAPLGDALASELPELSTRDAALIRAGEASGTLRETFARIMLDRRREPTDDPDTQLVGYWPVAYLALSVLPLLVVGLMVISFVIPKFADIFRDFGAPLPTTTRWFARAFNALDGAAAGLLVIFALVIVGTLIGRAVGIIFPALRVDLFRFARPAWERLLWHLPLVGRWRRDRDVADACATIGASLYARRPFDLAVRDAATQEHLSPVLRDRLERWHALLRAGRPINAAARAAGMPDLISGLLTASPEAADAFAFLARHYRARSYARARWLAAAVMPVLTIVCGGLVAAFAMAVLVPVWSLIDVVAPSFYRAHL